MKRGIRAFIANLVCFSCIVYGMDDPSFPSGDPGNSKKLKKSSLNQPATSRDSIAGDKSPHTIVDIDVPGLSAATKRLSSMIPSTGIQPDDSVPANTPKHKNKFPQLPPVKLFRSGGGSKDDTSSAAQTDRNLLKKRMGSMKDLRKEIQDTQYMQRTARG